MVQEPSKQTLLLVRVLQVRHLKRTALILPEHYPSFTLLRQAIGAVKLGYEALTLMVPEVSSGIMGAQRERCCSCSAAALPGFDLKAVR
jgi:hypothetical protein